MAGLMANRKHSVVYVTLKEQRKALLRRLKLPQYLGDAVECPVCGTHLRQFKPIWKSYLRKTAETGYVYPLSALETFNYQAYSCPACDASDRERLYALYLDGVFRSLDHGRRHRMVEFAPSGALKKKLKSYPFIEHRGADLYRKTVADNVDITDMRIYPDNSRDLFLCSRILEHVEDDRKTMREFYRVLKPGGFGIVVVPIVHDVEETLEQPGTSEDFRWKCYGSGDHLRQYGKRDLFARLTAAGLRVELVDITHFPAGAFARAGIAEDSVFYVVHKDAQARRGAA